MSVALHAVVSCISSALTESVPHGDGNLGSGAAKERLMNRLPGELRDGTRWALVGARPSERHEAEKTPREAAGFPIAQ